MKEPLTPGHIDDGEIFTLKEVAAYLRLSTATIYRLANARRIPAIKIGRTWRFYKQAVKDWMGRFGDDLTTLDRIGDEQAHKE